MFGESVPALAQCAYEIDHGARAVVAEGDSGGIRCVPGSCCQVMAASVSDVAVISQPSLAMAGTW